MYRRSDAGFSALRWAYRLRRIWGDVRGNTTYSNMSLFIPEYRKIWTEAARQIGGEIEEVEEGLWRIRWSGRATWVSNYKVQMDDPVVLDVAGNKVLTLQLLKAHGIVVPDHLRFRIDELALAHRFMKDMAPGLFVVKPMNATSGGRGVTTHIETEEELRRAAALASLYGKDLLIEQMIAGESYRLLVLEGRLIHASRRKGLRVIGDGISTVGSLVLPLRKKGGGNASRGGEDSWEKDVDIVLEAQGLSERTILKAGESALVSGRPSGLHGTSELATRYDEDVTRLIGPDMRDQAERAAVAVGSRFAGVDIITVDPCVSLARCGGAINEVNTTPGMHNHYGLRGTPEDSVPPAVLVLRQLLGGEPNSVCCP